MNELDYKDADVILMVYSIDKESTFESLTDMHEKATTLAPSNAKYFLVGNKVDLDKNGKR